MRASTPRVFTLFSTLLVVLALVFFQGQVIGAALVTPVLVEGNPSCTQIGYPLEYKVEPPASGTYQVPGHGSITLTTTDGVYFDWSSTFGISAVISKGGPNANVFYYNPAALGDSGLYSPDNDSGSPAGLSHVSFCFLQAPTPTNTPTTAPTNTPVNTPTNTPVNTPTNTPTVGITVVAETPTVPPMNTPTQVVTVTATQPATQTPTTAVTPTSTSLPTFTPTVGVTVLAETPGPTATPEAVQFVLPETGAGGTAGGAGGALSVAVTLTGAALAWTRRKA